MERYELSRASFIWFCFLISLLMFSCTKGEVSVSSFGKTIPAPVVANSKTVNGGSCDLMYSEMSGTCHLTVKFFEVSLDEVNWVKVPSDLSLFDSLGKKINQVTVNQDTSCVDDGKFKFSISGSWLANTFGIQRSAIEKVYIRGSNESLKSIAVATNSLAAVGGSCQSGRFLKGKVYALDGHFTSGIGSGGNNGTLSGSIYKVKGGISAIVR